MEKEKKFALIGYDIEYSLSPKIHTAIYSFLGIKADYVLISIAPENLENEIERLKGLDGFNVTQPHKNAVTGFLDDNLSPFGAVNTVKVNNGRLTGYNTDAEGFRAHLDKLKAGVKGMKALVLGAGGMAAAAAGVLKQSGADVTVYNRTFEKAEKLSLSLGVRAVKTLVGQKPEIAVSCVSAPLKDKQFMFERLDLSDLKLGYETIYSDTKFLEECKKTGALTTGGLPLLILQAIAAEEIFLDIKISGDIKDKLFDEIHSKIIQTF